LDEGRGEVDTGVVDGGELLALVIPRALGANRETLAAPFDDGTGILSLGDARSDRLGEAHGTFDDGSAFRAFRSHGDVDGGALRCDACLVLASDGDGDVAHGSDSTRGMAGGPDTLYPVMLGCFGVRLD